ncbi:hypothetical protein JCM10213_005068 [Rhodosporidiobolus nylandii]
MLDRLPPELLDEVLLLAILPPSPAGSSTRRTSLQACSLVSKAVGARAQPLLWREVELTTTKQVEAAAKHADKLGSWVRSLQLATYDPAQLPRGLALATACSNLVELDFLLSMEDSVDLLDLKSISHVRILTLQNLELVASSASAFLPKLEHLSLRNVEAASAVYSSLFTQQSLPNLSALALAETYVLASQADFFRNPLAVSALPDLFRQQLLALQFRASELGASPSTCQASSNILLTRTHSDQALRPALAMFAAPHVQLAYVPSIDETTYSYSYRSVRRALKALHILVLSTSKPRSLHLPISLHPDSPPHLAILRKNTDKLLRACEAQGVEVVWRTEGPEADWKVSQDFLRYVRNVKAAKEAQGAEA